MITKEYRIHLNGRGEVVYLVPLGDLHVGTKNCDEDKLLATIEYIREHKNVYWIGIGDYIEAINYTDKRFDPDNLSEKFQKSLSNLHLAQMKYVIDMLKPIRQRCMGLLEGNHEDKIRLHYHTNVTAVMAYELGVDELGNTCMIRWVMERSLKGTSRDASSRSVVIFATHGWGGGRTIGAKVNRIQEYSKYFDADIYLMGHVHNKLTDNEERLYISPFGTPRLYARKRVFGITGSFFKTYQEGSKSYAEKAGYPPTTTGVIKVRIEPFVREHHEGKQIEMPPHIHISE